MFCVILQMRALSTLARRHASIEERAFTLVLPEESILKEERECVCWGWGDVLATDGRSILIFFSPCLFLLCSGESDYLHRKSQNGGNRRKKNRKVSVPLFLKEVFRHIYFNWWLSFVPKY